MSTTRHPSRCFPESLTCRDLTLALQAEAAARRRYLLAAEQLESSGLHVAAHAFRFTAAQEKEHEAIFRGLLRVSGAESPDDPADEPVLPPTPAALLESVLLEETEESRVRYPSFARDAQAEGYPRIAAALLRIADTEELHARRFAQYLGALRDDSLFHSPVPTAWLCLPCGHLHFGADAPESCDVCARSRGHFIRSDFHPFTVAH